MEPDLTGLQVDRLIRAEDDPFLEIDNAVLAKPRNRRAGLRVQRDQPEPGRHEDDAIVALAVGPVRDAAAGELPWGNRRAPSFAKAVHPHLLARLRVERDDRPPGAGGRIHDSLDHERRPFELELGTRTQVVGLEPPRNLELVEVRCVDLIERHVPRALHVGRVVRPLAVAVARESALASDAWRLQCGCRQDESHREHDAPG